MAGGYHGGLVSARVGHWSAPDTGVTVVLPPPGSVGSGEVRGGAPASREFALLDPNRMMQRVDAVVLSGGSAFGLAAADGVMAVLRERGQGYPTRHGPVPIVIGMSIFDGSVRGNPPDAEAGRLAACSALEGQEWRPGRVGAGNGASTGKWRHRRDPGGLGIEERRIDGVGVGVLAVVNAWGDVIAADGRRVFDDAGPACGAPLPSDATGAATENTTLAVVVTDARLSKAECFLLAQSGHDGFAQALDPAHSRFDGDAVVVLATGSVEATVSLDVLRQVTTRVTAAAIRSAVDPPSASDMLSTGAAHGR